MPKEIWGEGRVCGMSSYEIYVKQHLAVDPNTPPASEREWLAASLAMGNSLLLKVPANISTGDRFIDIQLPHNSNLAAANTIVASFFDGEAHFPGDDDPDTDSDSDTDSEPYPWDKYWADRITDYGQLISNNSSQSPDGIVTDIDDTSKLPTQAINAWSERKQKQLIQYMNVIDGIVIQPGNWITATNQPPEKDFIPNLANTHPRVRLHMRGSTSESPLILLTGFTMNSVLNGITGDEGSTNTNHPENGDFLGPEDFPWVSKIVFSVPNSFINYMVLHSYTRELKNIMAYVDDIPIIDMEATNPVDFYNDYTNPSTSINLSKYYSADSMSAIGDPRQQYWVAEASKGVNTAVLTVYQKDQIFPPALYGNYVVSAGHDNYLSPLDIVAPGSVKMFYNSASTATAYENEFPGTHAFNLTSSGKLQYFYNNNAVTLADSGDIPSTSLDIGYLTNSGTNFSYPYPNSSSHFSPLTGTDRPKLLRTYTTDGKSEYSLMMSNDTSIGTNPTMRTVNSNPAVGVILNHTNSGDNITWSALLAGLAKDKSIDLLGDNLKRNKYSLRKSVSASSTASNYTEENVWDTSKGTSYLLYGTPYTDTNDQSPDFGKSFDGKRLYLTNIADIQTNRTIPDNNFDYFSDNGPNTTNIPVGSIALGWGWHSAYKLISNSSSSNGKCWAPLYGSEFDCGTINHQETKRFEFSYGFIIFGRSTLTDTHDLGPDNIDKWYWFNTATPPTTAGQRVPNTKTGANNHLLIIFVDQYARVHYISECSDDNVVVKLRFHVNNFLVRGTSFVELTNNSPDSSSGYYMNYMLIGKLSHRL